ncbi:MAG: tRNA pseudouridine synthase A [Chitinophagaceae bacterium]|nr:tRNA pseudouridine synthase A [Chitinophagaceae bacterium]
MPRYFIEVQYDGTAFHGSQIQGQQATVQYELNKALSLCLRQPVATLGASRTDEGVHALGNFYHCDIDLILDRKNLYNLNAILPATIAISNIYLATDATANARFQAVSRQYRYRIYKHKNPFSYKRALHFPYAIDRAVLDSTAQALLAHTNFETFSKKNAQTKTFNCTLYKSEWQDVGDELHYVVWGNRFLRGMVRALVGTQLRVARGKYTLQQFEEIILAKDCSMADFSVPGFGLYLEQINYPEGLLLPIQ